VAAAVDIASQITLVVPRRRVLATVVKSLFHFYEKVIKVKADVAALLILFSPTSTTLRPVAWRAVKGAVFWRSSRPLTARHATS